MIIDSHVHITDSGKWFSSSFDASVNLALKQMNSAKISRAVVLNVAGHTDNLTLAKLLSKFKDRFHYFAHLDFKQPNVHDELDFLVNNHGFSGLKIHPRIQNIDPLDPLLLPVYDKAVELRIPVLFCCLLQSNTVELEKFHPFIYDTLAKKYPNLKIIMAHCGWPRIWDAYHVVKSNKNVYMDISYIVNKFQNTSLMNDIPFMLENLDQKMLYGSDFPENSIDGYFNIFKSISANLTQEKLDNICYKNIIKLLERD